MAMPKKSLMQEFKEFIWSGDLIMIAVGLILALQVKDVIDSLIRGVINPILAAIVSQPNFDNFGFDLGDSRVLIGLVINALIRLVVVGLVLFAIVKLYNAFRAKEAAKPTETELLIEIRDLLRSRQP